MHPGDELANAVEILPGRFYFVCLKRPDSLRASHIAASSICFCIDDELLYEPFFADFGPLNLGKANRFCLKIQEFLQEGDRCKKRLYYYCGPSASHKANAAVLVGIYQVIFLGKTAEDAYKPLLAYKPYVPFRDASCGVSTFHLTVYDCIKGIQKARDVGFIDWNSGNSTWSLDEYEHYEQVENGDLNWIVPGKLVAFSGPAARPNEIVGYRLHTPEDYWDYYKQKGVTAVVRLNKKVYDRKRFADAGFHHYDLYFPDGSCPTEAILFKFLEIAETEPGALAVHCKAGLGRTGVLICCYIMKHYKFTAEEVIGYIRICRPGSVIGPQQNFVREVEQRMWQEGEAYRQQRGISRVGLEMHNLVINGRSAAAEQEGPYGLSLSAKVGLHHQRAPRSDSATTASNIADVPLLHFKVYSTGASMGGGHAMSYAQHVQQVSAGPAAAAAAAAPPAVRGSRGYSQRSITPLRYAAPTAAAFARNGVAPASQQLLGGAPGRPLGSGNINSKSMPAMPSRSPSADRSHERLHAASLRATLHTDTLRAADRPKVLPERHTQSAEINPNWRVSGSPTAAAGSPGAPGSHPASRPSHAPAAAAAATAAAGHRAGHAVARTLAPNGQPRKVPVAILPQYHASLASGRPSSMQTGSGSQPDLNKLKSVAQLRYGLHSK